MPLPQGDPRPASRRLEGITNKLAASSRRMLNWVHWPEDWTGILRAAVARVLLVVGEMRRWITLPPDQSGTSASRPENDRDGSTAFFDSSRVISLSIRIVVIFILGFAGWAAFVPLNSALLASGVVVVESHRRPIQHLEGGIIQDVLVKEGQRVSAGQVLVRLDDKQARASVDLLQGEVDALAAEEARLVSERDSKDRVTFPSELLARATNTSVAQAMQGEVNAFESRRQTLAKQVEYLNGHVEENARIIAGLIDEKKSLERQILLSNQEISMLKPLVKEGYVPKTRMLALERQFAELDGQRGQVIEKIAQTNVNTGETQAQIVNLRNQQLDDILKELRDVQTKRFDLLERLQAASDVYNRTVLRAQANGRVVGLSVHSRGAVVRPGDMILEIVPLNDKLEVEAHVRPEDADEVQIGLPAKVNFTAYKQRRLPVITGTVVGISSDRLLDQRTGQAYFNAIISVDRASTEGYPDIRIIPGMPVEIAIETGSRTMLSYLVEPIQSVLRRGMREK